MQCKEQTITLKISLFYRIMILIGGPSLGLLYCSICLPEIGAELPILIKLMAVFVGVIFIFLPFFLSAFKVVITPQYIKHPHIRRPILWEEIDWVQLTNMNYGTGKVQVLNFYLKNNSSVQLYVFNIFPTKKTSFSIALPSIYPKKQRRAVLEAIAKYTGSEHLLQ